MISEGQREGIYIKVIAAELGVHPRTVRRALQRGSEPPSTTSSRSLGPRHVADFEPGAPPGRLPLQGKNDQRHLGAERTIGGERRMEAGDTKSRAERPLRIFQVLATAVNRHASEQPERIGEVEGQRHGGGQRGSDKVQRIAVKMYKSILFPRVTVAHTQ